MKHPRFRELILLAGASGVLAIAWVQLGEQIALAFFAFMAVFAVMHLGVRVLAPKADPLLLPLVAFLVAMGFMQLAAIDLVQSAAQPRWRPYGPLQAGWLAASAAAFWGTLYLFRRGLGPAWRVRYTLALGGLAAIFAPLLPYIGREVQGARLWLRLGPFSFQPGEAAKVMLVLFLAAYLAERRELLALPTRRIGPLQAPDPRYLAPLLGVIGLALVIFVQQNDLGSPLLFFVTFLAIIWIATGRLFYPLTGIALFAAGVWIALRAFPHVRPRFDAWLNPYTDPQGGGFQIIQSWYGMAEGGIIGVGLSGPDTQPHLIPLVWTDFIIASIGHTMGLAGLLAVVMAFILLLTRAFLIGLRSSSDLHVLAAAGFAVAIGSQAGIIAAGVFRVLPLTGVTLPFVSYGGSSLVANFVIVACLLAISNAEATTEYSQADRESVEVAA